MIGFFCRAFASLRHRHMRMPLFDAAFAAMLLRRQRCRYADDYFARFIDAAYVYFTLPFSSPCLYVAAYAAHAMPVVARLPDILLML